MKMTRKEEAVACFRSGFVCSQAVLSVFAEDYGLDRNTALKLGTAFGGGIARRAETCGAVTGALMVIGLGYGRSEQKDTQAKETTYRKSQEFIRWFTERHGAVGCRSLLEVDISTPEGTQAAKEKSLFQTLCPEFVEGAVEILEKIL